MYTNPYRNLTQQRQAYKDGHTDQQADILAVNSFLNKPRF